jgi:hypothetical protein
MSQDGRVGGPTQIPLSEFSTFNSRPRPGVMVVAKGYADDSRKDGHVWIVGGYAGHDLQWEEYESMWPMALANHDVPYFHMREFADPKGVYAKWHPPQDHQEQMADFFGGLTKVIGYCHLRPFFSIARIPDLARFNGETGANLEPYPLAAYGCMLMLAYEYEDEPIEIIFDHLEKVASKLKKATEYAEADRYNGKSLAKVLLAPLRKELTFRNVIPLQAADFFSWEVRKHHLKADDWFMLPNKPIDEDARWEHFRAFHFKKTGTEQPTPRKSFAALVERTPPPRGIIWTYENLMQAHHLRGGMWT